VVPDLGEKQLLGVMLKTALLVDANWRLHLFQNNYSPNRVSEITDFVEANFDGYDVVELDRSVWLDPVSIGGVAYSTYGTSLVSWLATSGSQTVYGYYVTDADDTVVLWAERTTTGTVVTTFTPFQMLPLMRLHSEFEPAP
jgi:hypothetical protein